MDENNNKNLMAYERVRLELQSKLILQGVEINDLQDAVLETLIKAKLLDESLGVDSFHKNASFQKILLDIRGC